MASGNAPVVVYTQPDRATGRGKRVKPGPVKVLAERAGIPVEQPASLRHAKAAERLADYRLDVLVVAAYGLLLPSEILAIPRLGCVNVHASLLPRWRGAAPVERAIMAGDRRTGVCLMQMDEGLDTGPVLARRALGIDDSTTGAALESALADAGAELLVNLLPRLEHAVPEAQPEEGATYAKKLTAVDSQIDWQQSAAGIDRQVRALCERAPAYALLQGERVRVLKTSVEAATTQAAAAPASSAVPGVILTASPTGIRVGCGEGVLVIEQLALARGKARPMHVRDAINGYGELFRPDRSFESA